MRGTPTEPISPASAKRHHRIRHRLTNNGQPPPLPTFPGITDGDLFPRWPGTNSNRFPSESREPGSLFVAEGALLDPSGLGQEFSSVRQMNLTNTVHRRSPKEPKLQRAHSGAITLEEL